jgi:hypothetical protein
MVASGKPEQEAQAMDPEEVEKLVKAAAADLVARSDGSQFDSDHGG